MSIQTLVRGAFYRGLVWPFLTVGIGLGVDGEEHLDHPGPLVVVANHNSHLDTLALMHLIGPRRMARFRVVAAGDYFGTAGPLYEVVRTLFNALPIRRGLAGWRDDPIQPLSDAVAAGESLILFPEGTRGEPERMARFKSGVGALLERHPGLPVVPVHMRGMGRILPKGAWYPVPFSASIRIGAPRTYAGSTIDITRAVERDVRALGGELES